MEVLLPLPLAMVPLPMAMVVPLPMAMVVPLPMAMVAALLLAMVPLLLAMVVLPLAMVVLLLVVAVVGGGSLLAKAATASPIRVASTVRVPAPLTARVASLIVSLTSVARASVVTKQKDPILIRGNTCSNNYPQECFIASV